MRIPSSPDAIVDAMTDLHPIVASDGCYWNYVRTHWRQLDTSVMTYFQTHLREHTVYRTDRNGMQIEVNTSQPAFAGPLKSYVTAGCPQIDRPSFFADAPRRGLTVSNGFLAFGEKGELTLLPHGPEHRSRAFLDTIYDPEKRCDYTLEVLGSYFVHDRDHDGDGKKRALLELFAIALFGGAVANRRGCMMIVTGEKGSGKSSLIEALVAAIFDRSMVASVSPHSFGDPQARFGLVGKLLNVADELEHRPIRDSGIVKAVLSGSEVPVKRLYRDLVPCRLTAAHLFIANQAPRFEDSSGALHDRLIQIHFTHRYARDFEDPRRIAERIAGERAGLLNLLAKTYKDMLQRGNGLPQIEVPKSALKRQQEAALEADAIGMFINQAVAFDETGRVTATEVRQHYNRWREAQGIKRDADAQEIAKKLREMLPQACPEPTTYKRKAYFKLRLLNDAE